MAEIRYRVSIYDDEGEKFEFNGSPAVMMPGLQVKYGIIDGLDVEVALAYAMKNEDAGDVSGLAKPEIGLKYVAPDLGVGGFLNVELPFGSEDIVGENPQTKIQGGVIYGKAFGQIAVNALAGYVFETEEKDLKSKQDALEIYAQGQYNVNEMIGPYLGVEFFKTFDAQYDGETVEESAGYLLTLQPGVNVTIDANMAAELSVPVTVMGKSNPAAWGIAAAFKYSI
ncbi:MAG TPA: hypothetical protein PK208_01365 [Fibrobacteria bacterium]|nr:hypothetical protein [Fibrobacteria bacterium]